MVQRGGRTICSILLEVKQSYWKQVSYKTQYGSWIVFFSSFFGCIAVWILRIWPVNVSKILYS